VLSKGVIVGSKKRSVAVIEPEHGVNCSWAVWCRGVVAQVRPEVKFSLGWEINPEILRSVNVVVLGSKGGRRGNPKDKRRQY
jgi:hypothetical protein